MNILSAENISRSFGTRTLFSNLSLGIEEGQKIALVGVNGCGKSSLLKILAKAEPPESGEVRIRKQVTMEYLPQQPDFEESLTIMQALFQSEDPAVKAIRDYEALTQSANPDPVALEAAINRMEVLEAWDYESRVKQILSKLGIDQYDQQISTLSGGQVKRIALAGVLLREPKLLILDEPTNHLDLDIIEWLETYLSSSSMTLIMVTHDRYFLDTVCNEILEIDNGELFKYKGNYEDFLEQKAERAKHITSEKDKAANLLRKELEWIRRMPKARGTKSKSRIQAFHDLKNRASGRGPEAELEIGLGTKRLGKKILEIDHLSKSFGDKELIRDFSYTFKRRERVGIVGKNGTGKSTFLNLITGKLAPDSGTITTGETITYGYYTQSGIKPKSGLKVLDYIQEVAEVISMADGSSLTASQLLNQFLFPPEKQHDFVEKLSGGELRRLNLLRILMGQPNFLILDEPTNDLDIITLNILEDFLGSFSGCLVVVSHDRYFMDKLVDHLFVFEGNGKIRDFPGNYTHFRIQRTAEAEKETVKQETTATQERVRTAPKKLSYNEQRELDQLDKLLPELEERKVKLESSMAEASSDFEKLNQLSIELEQLKEELDEKEFRWLELSEKAG